MAQFHDASRARPIFRTAQPNMGHCTKLVEATSHVNEKKSISIKFLLIVFIYYSLEVAPLKSFVFKRCLWARLSLRDACRRGERVGSWSEPCRPNWWLRPSLEHFEGKEERNSRTAGRTQQLFISQSQPSLGQRWPSRNGAQAGADGPAGLLASKQSQASNADLPAVTISGFEASHSGWVIKVNDSTRVFRFLNGFNNMMHCSYEKASVFIGK